MLEQDSQKPGISSDAFWDVSQDVTSQKTTMPYRAFSSPVHGVDIIQPGTSSPADTQRTLHFASGNIRVETYVPKNNYFIDRVTIESRSDAGTFYRQFLLDAQKYLYEKGTPGEYIPFFSYMPQYSQMSQKQLSYYLHWRECVKQGIYLKTDNSYLLLYVYELINLGGSLIPKEEALLRICHVWQAYGKRFPKLNKYVSQWLSDYALIHQLDIPSAELKWILKEVLDASDFRELYVGSIDEITLENADCLLALLSDYDWRSSRYAKGDTQMAFETHMTQSMLGVFRALWQEGALSLKGSHPTTTSHNAYCGAIWAHDTKYHIEMRYYPISGVEKIRSIVTAMVRYSENTLRSRLSLRARLAVESPNEEMSAIIDSYYRVMYPPAPKTTTHTTSKEPSYMHLYEAGEAGIQFERAAEIEALSWSSTKKLIEDTEETDEVLGGDSTGENEPALEYMPNTVDLSREEIAFLQAILSGDTTGGVDGIRRDTLAEAVNTYAHGVLEDIVLELADRGYRVISDYIEEVTTWCHL